MRLFEEPSFLWGRRFFVGKSLNICNFALRLYILPY